MTLRQYLILMGLGTAVSWTAVVLVLTTVDPDKTSAAVFAIFYASVFLAVTGTLSIAGFTARVLILKKQLFLSKEVAVSFRQAVLVAALAVGALVLQSRSLLTWWTAAILVAAMTVFEFFFISARNSPERGMPRA
jgi:hypothetical protein